MSNEHWEEINEWEIEEDIDLAQRITVHAVHSIDDDEEYQLIQAHKHPTYAAAAKWGELKKSSNSEKQSSSDSEKSSSKNEKPSSSKSEKTSSSKNEKASSSKSDKPSSSKSDKTSPSESEKTSSSKNEETSKNNITNNISSEKKKLSSSISPKGDDNESADAENILKGDHDVDYDPTPSSTKNRKETRRKNTKLHKIHSKKLMSSLISDAELESNQDLVKGDTNRDPEFKQYKLLKKSLALNKKYSGKAKNDKKDLGKLHVEVW